MAIEITHTPLLKQAELGRSTRRGYDLPGEGYVYGISTTGDRDGAAKTLASWSSLETTKKKNANPMGTLQRSRTLNDRDFVALNRAATRRGLFTSQDFTKFRSTHNIVKDQFAQTSKPPKEELGRVPPETVFGQPTLPCTPVFDVLEHKYQQKWLQERREQELRSRAQSHLSKDLPSYDMLTKNSSGVGGIYETRASLLRKYLPPIENHELWQLKKFQKIGPHVSTFRSESARKSALNHQELDGASRFGYLGQGAYEIPPY